MVRNVVARWLATASLAALVASVASAQDRGQGQRRGGGGGFGGGGKIALVQNERVQQELKLSDDQKAKVAEIAEQVNAVAPRRGQDAAQEADREQQREQRQEMARLMAEVEKKLDEALNEQQKQRLDQLALQMAGARALVRDEVASKLGLSDEQKQKVQAVLREQRGPGGRGQGDAAAQRERRQQTEQQVLEVLTAEQQQKWEELKGEPFQLQGRRGGGGERERRRPQN